MSIEDLYKIFCEHSEITTDSRNVPEGSLFFALKGETFDGNQYAVSSLEQGAAFAVIDDKEIYEKAQGEVKDRLILASDVLATLQHLANYHRCQLGTTIVGVTGTNGKTTTKELIAAVLQKKYNVLYTQGNFNNHIGVPKTLLRLTKDHQIAVIEMGANHPGEIKTLVEIVQPDYGIITNVGKAHLLGFGSFEGVIKTKGELYDYLREDQGTVFINNDNEHLKKISNDLRLIRYGQKDADNLLVKGELIECNPFLKFSWNQCPSHFSPMEVQTKLIGSYNLDNALAAACIGTLFAVPADDITAALSEYTPSNNRSQMQKTADNNLVIDAYNANPTSMAAALDNFRLMKVSHKMCILGDMKELGEASSSEHKKVVEALLASDFEQVWLVGEEFNKAALAVDSSFFETHPSYKSFKDVEDVKSAITSNNPKGFTILIKGSNSTKLIQTVDLL
jgi:UDP-N-acetylmuramoyl-tripeptide--D-alanyl-D-alanine ligase